MFFLKNQHRTQQITSSQDNFSVLIWTKLPITLIRWHSNKLVKKFRRIMLLRQIYARITQEMKFYELLVQSWTMLVSLPGPNTCLVGLNSKTNYPMTEFCKSWFRKRCRILEKVCLSFDVFQKKGQFSVHNWTD